MRLDTKHKVRLDERFQYLQDEAHKKLMGALDLKAVVVQLWGTNDLAGFAARIRGVAHEYREAASLYDQIASECETALSTKPSMEK